MSQTESSLLGVPTADLIPAMRIAEELPIHKATFTRWCRDGVLGGIRLKGTKIGGRWFVSRAAVGEFLAACAAAGDSPAAAACAAPAES